MTTSPQVSSRFSVHLDAFRGVAALAVVAYHVRGRFFIDYTDQPASTLLTHFFFGATAFGHDAVMVFFVLSGYLISGTVLKDVQRGRWSWTRYLANRLTRLYVVLIPGLSLTLFWDVAGLTLARHHPVYTGAPASWAHDFFDVSARLTPTILAGNLAFLQAILVVPFGSNVPLWSLAYEAGYYLLFPLTLLLVWRSTSAPVRVICAASLAVLSLLYSRMMFFHPALVYAPIWLFGVAIHLLPPLRLPRDWPPAVWGCGAGLGVVVFASAAHVPAVRALFGHSSLALDYTTGLITMVALYVLKYDPASTSSRAYAWTASWLASVSFTLYVVHFPLLVFLRSQIPGRSWVVTPRTVGLALLITGLCVGYALLVWCVSEAHTARVRAWFSRRKTGD